MLAIALFLQIHAADSVYSTPALREFIARASVQNRAPPLSLAGYKATVETELALILRDSLGRELVGQLEQLAASAEWERNGRYKLHVVGFRSQSLGTPYSALTFTRMYTVPTLYGNRLVIGLNDGIVRTGGDSNAARRRRDRDTSAGRDPFRAIHPLATDRDHYYRFSGGDTVAVLSSHGRTIRLLRVAVAPIRQPASNFAAFVGELDFDADRHQLVRMRGRLEHVTHEKDPLFVRSIGAVAIAFLEFENAEINGRYWLPAYQRSEFQAQMGILGDVRPIYRIVSRFRNYALDDSGDSVVALSEMDTIPRTRATLTFAGKDSISRYGEWQDNLGAASGRVGSDDFVDLAPDIWRPSGKPRYDYWPKRLEEVARYNRVEGMFTGVAGSVRFRDVFPGLSARAHVGVAWEEETLRGGGSATLARGLWIHNARAERMLASTNDFPIALESGLSIWPILGTDPYDYVDRWIGAFSVTRILRDVDRAIFTNEIAVVRDRPEVARLKNGLLGSDPFLPNRVAFPGDYVRGTSTIEWHPRVVAGGLAPGFGGRLMYEIASGDLDWQRLEARIAVRKYWHGVVFASNMDAGAVMGSRLPPQVMYELGGSYDLPSYDYKEFGGDRAAVGRGLAAYYFPVLRRPFRIRGLVLPGISPGIGTGVQAGWTEASSPAARSTLSLLGSVPSQRIRATTDVRLTLLSGAIGAGVARPIDQRGEWKPFFVWGAAF